MDDPRDPQSIADDPRFLASLSELDRGLAEGADAPRATPRDRSTASQRQIHPPLGSPFQQRASPSRRMPLPPSIVSPFDAMTMNEPPAQSSGRVDVTQHPADLRPLLDLFPPEAPAAKPAPTESGPAAAPIAVKRSAGPKPLRAPATTQPSAAVATDYESFYGFTEKPFALTTDPRFFFHSTPHDSVSQQLLTAVRKHEGLVVLTGETGTGKTTLCRTVIEQLEHRTLTSLVTDPFVTGEDLLKTILVDFGVMSHAELARSSATRHELSTTLHSFIESLAPLEASAIVIIDEAQNLPPDVMEQVRHLADAGEASSRLQVVLVGQPSLTALLRRREYAALLQRVTVRAMLTPLPADEIDGYIVHRLAVAGQAPRVHFDQPALEQIYRLSRGVPRVVNLLCDRALARGFEASASVIDTPLIEGAAEDLDLGEPRSPAQHVASGALAAIALALCLLAGAGLAALVFHDTFARALALWQR